MRVNIQRAKIYAHNHPEEIGHPEELIHGIEDIRVTSEDPPARQGFRVYFETTDVEFPNVMALCQGLEIRPESLRAAVEDEGFEIAELEIRRIRLEGMDADGADLVVERTSEGRIDPKPEPNMSVELEPAPAAPDEKTGWFAKVFEDARRRSAGRPDWFKPASLLERVERAQREFQRMLPDERVERTSEGRIDPESEPNPYKQIALDLAALVADKQRQYGDSAGRTGAILRVLYPNGIGPEDYDRALLIVRVLDKISRLATNKQDLGGESPWRDIAGYALLALESPQKGF